MSDPKLKEAMAEIFGVLKKHDIAGQVTLVSKTHSEFRSKIDPTWSCASFEDFQDGMAIRFKIKKADVPDKEQRRQIAEWTLHILAQIRDLNAQNFLAFDGSLTEFAKFVKFDHKPHSGFEKHRDN